MDRLPLRAAVLVSNVSRGRTPGLKAIAVLAGEGGEKKYCSIFVASSQTAPSLRSADVFPVVASLRRPEIRLRFAG